MNYSNHTDGHVDSHGGYDTAGHDSDGGYDTDGRYDTDSRFTRDAYVLDRENIPYDRYFPESSVPPRLRHQVLVDGRLVDSWTERVEGTRWEQVARDFDAESRCPHQLFPSRPLRHPFEEVLDWLEGLVGGPQHLDALDTVALTVPARPVLEDPWQSDQLDAVESLLDSVAVKLFGGDAQPALRQGLLHVWDDSPDLVLHPKSTAHTAGGICWAVGRANGWFHPHTNLRQKDLQRHLWLKTPISSAGGATPPSAARPRSAALDLSCGLSRPARGGPRRPADGEHPAQADRMAGQGERCPRRLRAALSRRAPRRRPRGSPRRSRRRRLLARHPPGWPSQAGLTGTESSR